MKNYDLYEKAAVFAAVKRHDKAYGQDDFKIAVLSRAYGCEASELNGGKYLQIDHIVPQNPHLDPEKDWKLIDAMGLDESAMTTIGGKKVYVVSGSDVIRAAFKTISPDFDIPLQDNIANLRVSTTPANRVKSNTLPGSMREIVGMLHDNAVAYLNIIDKMEAQAQPKASRLARNIGVPVEMPSDYRIIGPHGEDRHLVLTGEFERCVDAFSKDFKDEIWILDDALDLKNGYTSLPGSLDEARESGTIALRILNQQENDIAHVLHAIEAVDNAKDETQNHLMVPDVNLFDAFGRAASMLGSEDKYFLRQLTAYFDEEMFIEGNLRVADKAFKQGVRIEEGFTGSLVDTTKRFYDSFANLKKEFLPVAETLIADIREQRFEERLHGVPVLRAA